MVSSPKTVLTVLFRQGQRSLLLVFALALLLARPAVAFAGGYEYGTPGARAEGRGGAEYAATDSPTALYFNPANLARIDRIRLFLAGNMIFSNNCMRREIAELGEGGTYTPAAEAATAVEEDGRFFLPETCNEARPSINPQLGVTIPIIEGLTAGVGLFFPVTPQIVNFGGENGTIDGTTATPTRYLMTELDVIQAYPTVGIGYSPLEQLRLGFAFGAGITSIEFTNYAYSDLLDADAKNALYVKDWFNPRITASVAATPIPGLDVAVSYTWTGDVEADGHLDIDLPEPMLVPTPSIDNVSLLSQQTWNLAFGVRYFKPLASPVGRVGDRLATERWDVEADFMIYGNERIDDFLVDLPDDATLSGLPVPDELRLPHRWKNQYIFRIGGDFNAIPGVFGARAGFSYESDGVKDGFEQLDFQPFRRFGLHAGATVRVLDSIDLSAAYTHLFQEDIDNFGAYCLSTPDRVNDPVCQQRPTSAAAPTADDLAIANAGQIRSSFNMLMIEATYTFGGPRAEPAEVEEPGPAYDDDEEEEELGGEELAVPPSEPPPASDMPPPESDLPPPGPMTY